MLNNSEGYVTFLNYETHFQKQLTNSQNLKTDIYCSKVLHAIANRVIITHANLNLTALLLKCLGVTTQRKQNEYYKQCDDFGRVVLQKRLVVITTFS